VEEIIKKVQSRAIIIGIAALVVSLLLAIFNVENFLHSYLIAFIFWTGLAIGSLAILMLHQLTGGMWGAVVRRLFEAATRTIPLLVLFFVPILLFIRRIYTWSQPAVIQKDEIIRHKEIYLNIPFFAVRAMIYFGVWIFLAYLFHRLSVEQDRKEDVGVVRSFQRMSGFGLLLYGLTATFASVDWVMSLEPHWFSTIFGLMLIAGQVLNAFAFVIVVAYVLAQYKPLSDVITPMQFKDLGNLMLTFVMLWAYLSFSQLLIIWSGNISEEIPWYAHRFRSGWQWIGGMLVLFHFAIPFLLLLSRRNKRNAGILVGIAIGILVMRVIDLFWLIEPEFHPGALSIHITDLLMPVALGGLWIGYFCRQLEKMPVVAMNDPNFSGAEI
jgi:hypothetical protein